MPLNYYVCLAKRQFRDEVKTPSTEKSPSDIGRDADRSNTPSPQRHHDDLSPSPTNKSPQFKKQRTYVDQTMKWKENMFDKEDRFDNDEYDMTGGEVNRNKKEAYYYYRRPPTHSAAPKHPEIDQGPPPHVAPYYYYTDKDLEIVHGKDDRKTITTLSRPTNQDIQARVTKRVATSPLKSSIQNAEVKISRGGVAISFDPWKTDGKTGKSVKPKGQFVKEYDHIASDDELRIADAQYDIFDQDAKSSFYQPLTHYHLGIEKKVDPKFKKLHQRNMEQAKQKRRTKSSQKSKPKKSAKTIKPTKNSVYNKYGAFHFYFFEMLNDHKFENV